MTVEQLSGQRRRSEPHSVFWDLVTFFNSTKPVNHPLVEVVGRSVLRRVELSAMKIRKQAVLREEFVERPFLSDGAVDEEEDLIARFDGVECVRDDERRAPHHLFLKRLHDRL